MVRILRGDQVASDLCRTVAADVLRLDAERGIRPGLAVVLVGEDPASEVYVRRKVAKSREVGVHSFEHRLPAAITEAELLYLISRLNRDPAVHGILVQLPLPAHISASKVLESIDPTKDVDGFHPVNVGRLSIGTEGLVPCTPLGCMLLLEQAIDDFRGLQALVIGASNIVGKPMALLLLERGCTVTVAHILTRDLPDQARKADLIVVAAGSPRLLRGAWVKEGAVIIDVGINRVFDAAGRGRIVGDVAADEMEHAGVLTPVPGGVGPMTIACLLANTVKAAGLTHHQSA